MMNETTIVTITGFIILIMLERVIWYWYWYDEVLPKLNELAKTKSNKEKVAR